MSYTKNELIDIFDRLNSSQNNNSSWKTAHELISDFGGKHIVCARLHNKSNAVLWLRTSMREDWINLYVKENYLSLDPIVSALKGDTGTYRIDTNDGILIDSQNKKEMDVYYENLHDFGYRTLMSHSFSSFNLGVTNFITICFDADFNHSKEINTDRVTALQSILSNFVNYAPGWHDEGLIKYGAFSLSPRERDVLSLLANGYQTARISEKLKISEVMVSKHFAKCRSKLKAATREQALALAMAAGAISL